MMNADLRQQAVKFEKARNNLLLVIIFTTVNLFLITVDAGIYFLFSATIPQLIVQIGKEVILETGSNIVFIICTIIAAVIVILYVVFWLLAKNIRVFILIALIYFSFDSLLLLYLILIQEFEFSFLLEIAFHVWILFCLISGTKAWANLRSVSSDDFKQLLQEIKQINAGLEPAAKPQQDEPETTEEEPTQP